MLPSLRRFRALRRARRSGGFTLIEAALTTVIVGVAFVAVLELIAAGTASNVQAAEVTTAVNLARSVRELALTKTFAELIAMDGASYQPPRDAGGVTVDEFATWTQKIDVQSVNAERLTQATVDPDPDAVRVTVTVEHDGNPVCDLSWYAFRSTQ